jgi:hypothetical protein
MSNAMMAFGIAVGGVSVACYLLMTRAEKRRRRTSRGDGSGPDGVGYAESSSGTILSWFGGGHHLATDSSGNPIDSSGGDIGGGGDSGGGGDGGGGGGGGGGD